MANYSIEQISPKEFVLHPDREKVLVGMAEKPKKYRELMDAAFKRLPVPVVPVLYALFTDAEGVERKGIIDGMARVFYAVKYEVETILAVQVDISDAAKRKIPVGSLVANQRYHDSVFEKGKSVSFRFNELSVPDINAKDVYSIIAADMGIQESEVQRLKIVYDRDPEELRKVDNDENYSLAAAYNTVKKSRAPKDDRYTDSTYSEGQEMTLNDSNTSTTIDSDTEDGLTVDESVIDNTSEEETESESDEDATADESEVHEVDVEVSPDTDFVMVKCPCCTAQLRINLKNNTTGHV